jgi:hypothetical protein
VLWRSHADARRPTGRRRRQGTRQRAVDLAAAGQRERAAGGRAGGARGRALAASPHAAVRRAREGPRSGRDRRRRRRRLRVLRRARGRQLRGRLLARPGPVRVSWGGTGICAGGKARATRASGRAAARGWSSTRWRVTASTWLA